MHTIAKRFLMHIRAFVHFGGWQILQVQMFYRILSFLPFILWFLYIIFAVIGML